MRQMFRGDYEFLSNFYIASIVVDGVEYKTSEHYYQSKKAKFFADWNLVRNCDTPGQSARLGNKIPMREDWGNVKLFIMEKALRAKFSKEQHPELVELLIATGDEELIEWNTWGDVFWGCTMKDGKGTNHLGKLLMLIRDDLRII